MNFSFLAFNSEINALFSPTVLVNILLKFYDKHGQGASLYLPLVGSGRSRVNLSNDQSYDLIVDTIMENIEFLQGKINIVVKE